VLRVAGAFRQCATGWGNGGFEGNQWERAAGFSSGESDDTLLIWIGLRGTLGWDRQQGTSSNQDCTGR
jgi:hypothetical protein